MMSRDAEALLAKGRASPPRPSDASRARMRERVLLQVGAAAVAGATVSKASPALASTVTKVGLTWKLAGLVLLSGGLVGGALAHRAREPVNAPANDGAVVAQTHAPPVSALPPRPASVTPAETHEPAVAAPPPATAPLPGGAKAASSPAVSSPAVPSPAVSSPAVSSPADALAEEAVLLKRARAALGSGDGAKALGLANEHASRYPSGVLSSERRLIRALALCATGSKAQGLSEGRASFPDESSAGRKRVEAACQ